MGSDLHFPLIGREVSSQGARAGVPPKLAAGAEGAQQGAAARWWPLRPCAARAGSGPGPHTCPSVL